MIWIADASDVGLLVTLLEPEKQRNPHQLSHCINHESYLYSHLRKGGEADETNTVTNPGVSQ